MTGDLLGGRRWCVVQGDILKVLADEPDNRYDGCFCDPPYGLSFMGKKWDHAVPGPDYWAEVLRVLKPGAMLLAFGGTRTWHRLACAIEDAGFEVRDTLMWLQGQGFPKSHNFSAAIDKHGGRSIGWFGPWLRQERQRRGINQKELARHFPSKTGRLTGCVANWELGFNMPTAQQFNRLCEVLDLPFERIEEAERENIGQYASDMGGLGGQRLGQSGGDITRPATPAAKAWDGYGTALKPAWEPVLLAMKPLDGTFAANALKWGVAGINVDGSRIGTEMIRTHGGGGQSGTSLGWSGQDGRKEPTVRVTQNTEHQGRFPANLLLSHLPECERRGTKRVKSRAAAPVKRGQDGKSRGIYGDFAEKGDDGASYYADPDGLETVDDWVCAEGCPVAMLDAQSGVSKSHRAPRGGTSPNPMSWGEARQDGGQIAGHTDKGGASRFFYCAKASRRERDAGLENLPLRLGGGMQETQDQSLKTGSGNVRNNQMRNIHPTVKPLALCEYLARLILPPTEYRDEARLLVPFCGSGSEMIGAIRAGWRHVLGIEIVEEYCEVARARLATVQGKLI